MSFANPATAELAACYAMLDAAIDDGRTLLEDMRDSGVLDVVYIVYPSVLTGANGPAVLEHLANGMSELCAEVSGGDFHCHIADLRPAFDGHPEYIGSDMIHPTATGSDRMAEVVWNARPSRCTAP